MNSYLYRNKYKRGGKTVTSPRWYGFFRFPGDRRNRIALFKSKSSSSDALNRIDDLRALRSRAGEINADLLAWGERLPERIRRKLIAVGLLDELVVDVSLKRHIDAWEEYLRGRATGDHARLQSQRVRRVLVGGCGFVFLSDIKAPAVADYLQGEREKAKGAISKSTSNHLRTACRAFTRWAVRTGRSVENALAYLEGIRVAAHELKRPRRALSRHEMIRLIEGARADGRVWHGLTGRDRALVWKAFLESGLRLSEVEGLRVGDLREDEKGPYVPLMVQKNGTRTDRHRINQALLEALRAYCAEKAPTDPVFDLKPAWWRRLNEILQHDLAVAKIAASTRDGAIDVHALRHSYCSEVGRVYRDPKTAQKLMRHSTMEQTARYMHTDDERLADAAESIVLPARVGHEVGISRGA